VTRTAAGPVRLTRRAACVTLAAALLATPAWRARAQPAGLRLYVLDAGSLGGKAAVVAYLLVHPKGTLLWEAGTIPDARIEAGTQAAADRPELLQRFDARASRTLRSQLAEIGDSAARISYFAASHYHFDHIANAGDYTAAQWLVQKADHATMFGGGPTPFGAEPSFYAPLLKAKTIVLNGDHDVFGDGSVVIKAAPGHTPGHQVLAVTLARTGPVILGGDVYHSPAERERPLETVPDMDANKEQSKATRTALEAHVKQTGAQFWIAHDAVLFKGQKKAPEYYD
jgi:N-acyl homoserine lactone hydrolase